MVDGEERRSLVIHDDAYEIFGLKDKNGYAMSTADHSIRLLAQTVAECEASSSCSKDCVCDPSDKAAKCKFKQGKCQAGKVEGIDFPILTDPFGSVISLFQGGDVSIIEFVAPPMEFAFLFEISFILYTPPSVKLTIGFEFTAVATFGVIYDTKGIREAIEQKDGLKALNGFGYVCLTVCLTVSRVQWTLKWRNSLVLSLIFLFLLFRRFMDTFDGVDEKLLILTAEVYLEASVTAVIVQIGVRGGIIFEGR